MWSDDISSGVGDALVAWFVGLLLLHTLIMSTREFGSGAWSVLSCSVGCVVVYVIVMSVLPPSIASYI